jgi:hypothetical protein
MEQVGGEGAGGEARLCGRRAHTREMIEAPAQLACSVVRRQLQSRQSLDVLGSPRDAPQPRCASGVLPRNDRGQGAAVGGIPAHEARALHGKARSRPARGLDEPRELGERGVHARDELVRVVLDVAKGIALRRDGDERRAFEFAPRGVRARARRMPALVDGDEGGIRHAEAAPGPRISAASRSGAMDSTIVTPRPARSSASAASTTS